MNSSLLSLLVLLDLSLAFATDPIVSTNSGTVQGFSTDLAENFLGIPFASPPIGNLRWKPPMPAEPWSGVLKATEYSLPCTQEAGGFWQTLNSSEDCLYLNVFVPLGQAPEGGYSSMVWIYGGSFVDGAGDNFDGEVLASQTNQIVVTFNYRVGSFGFLALPALANEDPEFTTTGNYGIQDQRFALQWVKANIQSFGGNPDRVTVFGESAGAISICFHLAAPRSAGAFDQAIMESGFCQMKQLPDMEQLGFALAALVGCNSSDLECLRSIPAKELQNAMPKNWFPSVDGAELEMQPMEYIQRGEFNRVPLLLGTNADEDSFWACVLFPNITFPGVDNYVLTSFGSTLGEAILEEYNIDSYPTPVDALTDITSDFYFKCPTRQLARAFSNSSLPVYLYDFNHIPGWSNDCYRVAHAFELPFIWNSLTKYFSYTFTPAEAQLSKTMISFWATFVETGTPGDSWDQYEISTDMNIVLDLELSTNTGYRNQECNFWSF